MNPVISFRNLLGLMGRQKEGFYHYGNTSALLGFLHKELNFGKITSGNTKRFKVLPNDSLKVISRIN